MSAWAGFSPIGPRNIRNQLLATTRDEKQQAKHRIPQFFSSLLDKIRDKIPTTAYDAKKQEHRELQPEEIKATLVYAFVHDCFHGPMGHTLDLIRDTLWGAKAGDRIDKYLLKKHIVLKAGFLWKAVLRYVADSEKECNHIFEILKELVASPSSLGER